MPLNPGMPPDVRGGNDPVRAAAQSNMQQGVMGQNDPSQLPQGGPPAAPMGGQMNPAQMGPSVGGLLADAWSMYVQNGARPEDTENIRQFFEAFVDLANTMSQDQAPAPQPAQPAPGGNPQRMAPAAPMPGRPS